MTIITRVPTLVSTGWLRKKVCILSTPQGVKKLGNSLRILDTSWLPEPHVDGYTAFYKEAHIPTAGYFDLKKITPPEQGMVKFPIPDSEDFEDYVQDLGISTDTHVIAYDRFNTRPSFRVWFLFRLFGHEKISVLNGGLRQWLIKGCHVTQDEPSFEPGNFEAKLQPHLLRNFEDMVKNMETQKEQVLDARGAKSFHSEEEGEGHIPNARNFPFSSLFNEDGTVKSPEDLKKEFTNVGIDLDKPLVSSCLLGMTACGLIAAAHILGKEDVPLYNGSFYEWQALAGDSKVERKGR